MLPVADPDKLMGVPGAEAAAVAPLNLLVPVAILALSVTSFQGWPVSVCNLVKLPVTALDPKFAVIETLPVPTVVV